MARPKLRRDPRPVPLPDAPHLFLVFLDKLARQLAMRRPDELDSVAPSCVFGERADATELVVGVSENGEESHRYGLGCARAQQELQELMLEKHHGEAEGDVADELRNDQDEAGAKAFQRVMLDDDNRHQEGDKDTVT